MQHIVDSLAHPQLIQAMELNMEEGLFLWGRLFGATFYQEPEMTWFVSDLPFELCNGVARARFPADLAESRIVELLIRLKAHSMPMSWIVGPSTSSSDNLERLMQTFGWKSDLIPGMAVDLAGLHQRQARWSGITVERVEHAESLQQWMQIAAAVSQFPDFVLDYALNALQTHGFVRHPQVEYYLGRLDGEAVATSALVLGGGVAGIYIVTTLPAARGKGLGTAVTLVPLLDARTMGYRVGILQSSDMGFNVYQRLGFQQYCSFNFCFFAASH